VVGRRLLVLGNLTELQTPESRAPGGLEMASEASPGLAGTRDPRCVALVRRGEQSRGPSDTWRPAVQGQPAHQRRVACGVTSGSGGEPTTGILTGSKWDSVAAAYRLCFQ